MGEAARRISHARTATPARPALRVVRGGRSRARARADARAAHLFRALVVFLVVLASAGVLRVTLAAHAAEATIDAWELRKEVKTERLVARTLEADRSALASPSRIEAVACQTLNMQRPKQVSYLQLPSAAGFDVVQGATPPADSPGVLVTLMDLAAGEAQVMLVGDVGLGSLR